MLNEADIIHTLKSAFPDYIGDDAALIPFSADQNYAISKDLLLEDVHFRTAYVDPVSLAHKSLHVNLSDLAAMGAKPQFVLLGISLPSSYETYAKNFFEAFTQACKTASVILIGGDTTQSTDKLLISITAIGVGNTADLKYRNTAQEGDLICVAGNLGHSHIGLLALESAFQDLDLFKTYFLKPVARVAEGLFLAQQPDVHSMMDISDGLFIDLQRLCAASGLAATLQLENFKVDKIFSQACHTLSLDPVNTMLIGGEDYGLLFTVDPKNHSILETQFQKKFGYDLQCIGRIEKGSDIYFTEKGIPKNLDLKPFSHFGELSTSQAL